MKRMKTIKRKILWSIYKSDGMNLSFKELKQAKKRQQIGQVLFGIAAFMVLIAFSLHPPAPDRIARLTWLVYLIGFVFAILFMQLYIMYNAHDTEIDMLRRELWFIEHRLGLPHDPEELEDIEAYNKWLREQFFGDADDSRRD